MLKQKQLFVLIFLILGTGVVSCNHGEGLRSGLHKDTSRSNKLVHELDNVPRAFAIDKLKKLDIVPEVPEKEGTVIGIVTEDRGIVCIDEVVLNKILYPLVTEHMERTMPKHRDFVLGRSKLLLSRRGVMALAVDFAVDNETYTGYLPTVLSTSSKATWPQCVLLPPGHSLGRCVKERNECQEGSCWYFPGDGCLCVEPGNKYNSGCMLW